MEATFFSETAGNFQRTARRYIPEDRTLYMTSNDKGEYRILERMGKKAIIAYEEWSSGV
jgi:hypothetical protein